MTTATAIETLTRSNILNTVEAAVAEYDGMTVSYDAARDVHTIRYEQAELQIFVEPATDIDEGGWAWRITDRDDNGYPVREESSALDSIEELRGLLDDL